MALSCGETSLRMTPNLHDTPPEKNQETVDRSINGAYCRSYSPTIRIRQGQCPNSIDPICASLSVLRFGSCTGVTACG